MVLERFFGLSFKNPKWLEKALSHTSFVNENRQITDSNERLEFLGDAVLDLAVSTILFERYPGMREGRMSKMRSAIVNEKTLAKICEHIGWQEFVWMGKGEIKSGGRLKSKLMARSLESLFGAIYKDQGYQSVHAFIIRVFEYYKDQTGEDFFSEETLDLFDPKSRLQEFFLKHLKTVPEYYADEFPGQGQTQYRVFIKVKGENLLSVVSHSKKKAHTELANRILENKYEYLDKLKRKNVNTESTPIK
jgi:ribonuclease-3